MLYFSHVVYYQHNWPDRVIFYNARDRYFDLLARAQNLYLLHFVLDFILVGVHGFNFEVFYVALAAVRDMHENLNAIRSEELSNYSNL